ncbi:MAG: malate dehydrogenase [Methanomicrobiales archaeon]
MKVSIVGASGRVGSEAAFCLAEENSVAELTLISREDSIGKVEGHMLDINDALAAKGVDVKIDSSHNIESVENSDIVVLTAGVPRTPDMDRIELSATNGKIIANYAEQIARHAPDSIILVVTNPVDVMTYVAYKKSGFEKNRVIGLGNHLDSLRLRNFMAKHFNVHVSEIHTRVIGQHGKHMVPLISLTSIGGIPLESYSTWDYFTGYKSIDMKATIQKVINAGSDIISKKGATEYGPAFAISNLVTTILNDEKKILTVSAYLEGEIEGINDICLGVPVKLGREGVEGIIPISMNENEREDFMKAAEFVKNSTLNLLNNR